MIVNTKTGKLTPTKAEQRHLVNALGVLRGLNKHGEGELSSAADDAAKAIDAVLMAMRIGVNTEGEPIAAPY